MLRSASTGIATRLLVILGGLATVGCGDDAPAPREGAALPPRPSARTCRLDGTRAEDLPRLEAVPAAAALSGARALAASPEDDTAGGLAGLSNGRLVWLDGAQDEAPRVVLDVEVLLEGGELFDVAVSPRFTEQPYVFVAWRRYDVESAASESVVSRFTWPAVGEDIDPASEIRVLTIGKGTSGAPPLSIALDVDGTLFVGVGDAEPDDTPGLVAQDRFSWLGKILRVDVDAIDVDGSYAIPDDNPYADGTAGAPEVWAVGLHHPAGCRRTTLSPDDPSESPSLVCADRGGGAVDEIDVVGRDDNLGWPVAEGSACRDGYVSCSLDAYAAPIATQPRETKGCGLTGGFVYRGLAMPALAGTYLYVDTCEGVIHGARREPSGAFAKRQVAALGEAVLVMGELSTGSASEPSREPALALSSGAVATLTMPALGTPGTFPTSLAQTGCYVDLETLTPAPDLVPYDVSAPLWTDGAKKDRFLVLPPGETIRVADDGAFDLPLGTIILKTFSLERVEGYPWTARPVETRVMIQQPEGWEFHTFRWNGEHTDAELLVAGEEVPVEVWRDGHDVEQAYLFPSRAACRTCHGPGRSLAVGPTIAQLNRTRDYDGVVANQLDAMDAIGLFGGTLPSPDARGVLPSPVDPHQSVEARARAYLHANCAHCHRPGGWTPPDLDMDLRFETKWEDVRACGVPALYGNSATDYDARIDPGSPDTSAIWGRMVLETDLRMPPIGVTLPDPAASVVREWIEGLSSCPPAD